MPTNSKSKGPTWSDVKSQLIKLDHKQLIQIISDMYRLSKENQDFLNARCGILDDPLAPFKSSIEEYMFPDAYTDKPIQISKAKTTIKQYCMAVRDALGEAELRTFFVECGNSFTLEYGDIDEGFYNALNLMYRKAIQVVLSLPKDQQPDFRERLKEIMESSADIGWGYHDELREDYYETFPDDQ